MMEDIKWPNFLTIDPSKETSTPGKAEEEVGMFSHSHVYLRQTEMHQFNSFIRIFNSVDNATDGENAMVRFITTNC
jgi:hypothetical protein